MLFPQEEGAIVGPTSVVMQKGMVKIDPVVIDLTAVGGVVQAVSKTRFPQILSQAKLNGFWTSAMSSPSAYISNLLPGLEVPCRVQQLKFSLLAFLAQTLSVRCLCGLVGQYFTNLSCYRRGPKRLWRRLCRRTSPSMSDSPAHFLRGSTS